MPISTIGSDVHALSSLATSKFRTEDLLSRSRVTVCGASARELVRDKVVMVTGAGGSIGSEIVRQAHSFGAARVLNVDTDEFALYTLQLELDGQALLDSDEYMLVDVRDDALMDRVVRETQPDIIIHAAAHKHLPLLERYPDAAAKTNVFGTESVMRAAVNNGVRRVVNISTDKAAAPTSALGWSKRLAECIAANYSTDATLISSVRFGNVLGSRGSFLPTMMWQIRQGIPLQITDPEVSRFFMSIPEAAGLVLEAGTLAGTGNVFVLDMGESVKIVDLVRSYVSLSGSVAPQINFTGLREGEKLSEVLFDNAADSAPTLHPRISSATVPRIETADLVANLRALVHSGASPRRIRAALEFSTPETSSVETESPVVQALDFVSA